MIVDPETPKFNEVRLNANVGLTAVPACAKGMLCPATEKFPLRPCDAEFAVTDQAALVADADIDAQPTLELAAGTGQSLGDGVIPMLPVDPEDATFTALEPKA